MARWRGGAVGGCLLAAVMVGCGSDTAEVRTSEPAATNETSKTLPTGTSAATPDSASSTPGSAPGSTTVEPWVTIHPVLSCEFADPSGSSAVPTRPPEGAVRMPTRDGGSCLLGAPAATGAIFEPDAEATIRQGSWAVLVGVRPGPLGGDQLNALAARCFARDETCPSGQAAVVISGVIVTAPAFAEPSFGGELQISADFSEAEAREIARTLRLGAIGVG